MKKWRSRTFIGSFATYSPQTTRKFNMIFSYSENDSDMTLNLIIARNNGFVKKKQGSTLEWINLWK